MATNQIWFVAGIAADLVTTPVEWTRISQRQLGVETLAVRFALTDALQQPCLRIAGVPGAFAQHRMPQEAWSASLAPPITQTFSIAWVGIAEKTRATKHSIRNRKAVALSTYRYCRIHLPLALGVRSNDMDFTAQALTKSRKILSTKKYG